MSGFCEEIEKKVDWKFIGLGWASSAIGFLRYMCLLKVANRQGSGDYARFRPTANTGATTSSTAAASTTLAAANVPTIPYFHMQQPDYLLSAVVSPPPGLSGHGQFREMSAMVTALTHVVSGQGHGGHVTGAGTPPSFGGGGSGSFIPSTVDSPSSTYSSSSSGSWAGQKRRRHHDDSVTQFSDGVYRGFGESSTSVKSGLFWFITYFFF